MCLCWDNKTLLWQLCWPLRKRNVISNMYQKKNSCYVGNLRLFAYLMPFMHMYARLQITQSWQPQECHLHQRRLWKVISRNLQGTGALCAVHRSYWRCHGTQKSHLSATEKNITWAAICLLYRWYGYVWMVIIDWYRVHLLLWCLGLVCRTATPSTTSGCHWQCTEDFGRQETAEPRNAGQVGKVGMLSWIIGT